MNLKIMMGNFLNISSSFSKSKGLELYKRKNISKVEGKSINNIYHIYGKGLDNKEEIRTHIQFDNTNNIISLKCTCNTFLENSREVKNYSCSHLVATMYKFYYLVIEKNNKYKEEKNITKELNLDIKLKQYKLNNEEIYLLELRAGEESTLAIELIGKFILDKSNIFSKNDIKVINYLKNKIKENKRIFEKRYFVLYKNELREFLDLIDENKSITLTYDYMNYTTLVYRIDIPLIFTLKKNDENIVLKPQKKIIIPLDEEKKIWIYDKKIMIPSEEQLKYYKEIYNKLKDKSYLLYKNNKENLIKILFVLGKISKDIIIDESIRYEVNRTVVPIFNIKEIDNTIYCELKIKYINDLDGIKDNILEEKIKMKLEKYNFIKYDGIFKFIGNDEEKYKFLKYGVKELNSMGKLILLNYDIENKLINSENIYSNIEDNFKFTYKMEGIEYREINNILNSLKAKKSFYKTKSNLLLDLEEEEVKSFFYTLEELNLFNDDYKGELYIDKFKLLYLDNKIKENRVPFINGKEKIKEITEKLNNKEVYYEIPTNLNAKLRDYQVRGYNFLKNIENLGFGAILADDMGLGKTIQTIALILSLKYKKGIVITPTAVLYNWKNEFSKFAKDLKIGIIHGSSSERNKIKEKYKEYDVLLTTYGTLRSDIDFYKNKKFDFCIIDEAQNIKNNKSKTTKCVKDIKSDFKLALTGTPIENNILELWSIFDYIMPMYLNTEENFKEKYYKINDEETLSELKNLISPFILRRLKEEVLDELPDKIEKEYILKMDLKEKQIYNTYLKEVKNKIREDKNNKILIFSYLTKLRQLCLDPSLLIDDYKEESTKIKTIKEIIKNTIENNKKIIIFSQFTKVLKKISKKLEEEKMSYLYLDGNTNAKDRIKLVDKFNNEKENIFLISLKAGGVGLNLTSAHIVVHFDPWWNPAVENQATDRAHRIGQKNVVEVIKLISKDTIEEKILKLQEEKKELIRKVIDGNMVNGDIISNITEEELLSLFD